MNELINKENLPEYHHQLTVDLLKQMKLHMVFLNKESHQPMTA